MTDINQWTDASFLSPAEIAKIQEAKLQMHVKYCMHNSPYYKKVFADSAIDPDSITLAQLKNLPFTKKSHVAQNNEQMLAAPRSHVADIVMSSGTTGTPVFVCYTKKDLERLTYNESQSLRGCGIVEDDIVLLTCTMDRCFIAGLAYFLGVRSIGAAAIRNGHGHMESHAEIISWVKPTTIIGVPSFLRKLGEYLKQKGNDPKKNTVSKLICIGEPLRNEKFELLQVGEDIETLWDAKAYSTYASSETITTFCECGAQQGGHLHPELAIIEIVDDDGVVLPSGSIGEVVVTPLAIEGMPLIRYKTGDISFLVEDPCSCGRFSARLGPILGRKKQMLKVKGTSLYPQAIYIALDEMEGVSEYYVAVTSTSELSDDVTIHVSVTDIHLTECLIQVKLAASLRVKPKVVIESDACIREKVYSLKSRKPIRFFDGR